MNLNYFSLSILLLIILISCSVIVFQLKNNELKKKIMQNNNKFFELINTNKIENFNNLLDDKWYKDDGTLTQNAIDELDGRMIISKIEIEEIDDSDNRKKIILKGRNLNKIKDVYFGEIKGIILEKNNNDREYKILPPNLNDPKYGRILSNKEIRNLEIKFHIQDRVEENKIALKFVNKEISINDIILKKDLELVLTPTESKNKIIKELLNGYTKRIRILFDLKDTSGTGKIMINKSIIDVKKGVNNEFYTDISRENIKDNDKLEISFERVGQNTNIEIKNLEVEYFADDIDIIFPSGLFYKPGLNLISTKTSNSEFDQNDWSIYLNQKGKETVSPILKDYYNKAGTFLTKEKEEAKALKPTYEINDLNIKLNKDTKNIDITWIPPNIFKIGKDINKDKFKYFIEFEPQDKEDLKNVFRFGKEVPIMEEVNPLNSVPQLELVKSYSFNKSQLKPGEKYIIKITIIQSGLGGKKKFYPTINKIYIFNEGLEDYHTHLYNPATDRFDLKKLGDEYENILANNPQLVATYYQMLAYNKKRAQDEVQIANLNIGDNVSCLKRNTRQFTQGNLGNNFQKNIDILVDRNSLKEGQEFDVYQGKQNEQIESIKKKIEEVEKHQNKKVTLSDLNIKALRSVIDGSILRLEELNGEKKLVKLNSGCLAYDKTSEFGKKDDYAYVPCNTFDKSQYFVLNKVNNLDEYNYLLANNLQPRVNENVDDINYPFYVLQPNESNKCVSVSDKKLQIKPCSTDESFKFKGYFSDKGCNV